MTAEPDWSLVHSVEDESGAHIEPPIDTTWPELWKLRWRAAVLKDDTGMTVEAEPANYTVDGRAQRGFYNLHYPRGGTGPLTYDAARYILIGFGIGVRNERWGVPHE